MKTETVPAVRYGRPKSSVGGRHGVSLHTRAMVADELIVCACEVAAINADAARILLHRAFEIRNTDA